MGSKFYVGQKVVALRNSKSDNTIQKDCIYTVLEIKELCCMVCIRVTESKEIVNNKCTIHGKEFKEEGKFFDQDAFSPIQEISDMTFEEAIELVTEKQLNETN